MTSGGTGRLVVFEGTEGVGKSTQLALLAERLGAAGHAVTTLREPGGTPVGDEVRRLVLHSSGDLDDRAEALLFMVARAQLVATLVRPALARGGFVLLDRFFLSTYAYQVAGRGLPDDEVRAANRLATGGLVPDLTLVLTLPAGEGLRRVVARGRADRMESADAAFHARVESAFGRALDPDWQALHPECGPIAAVDAGGPVEAVAERVAQVVGATWRETFAFSTVSDPGVGQRGQSPDPDPA